jgi:hypothetical protein
MRIDTDISDDLLCEAVDGKVQSACLNHRDGRHCDALCEFQEVTSGQFAEHRKVFAQFCAVKRGMSTTPRSALPYR